MGYYFYKKTVYCFIIEFQNLSKCLQIFYLYNKNEISSKSEIKYFLKFFKMYNILIYTSLS